MAIYDHQYGELSYFRVFRAWGGKEHQEYVRIKRSRKAAYSKAQEIDARFAKAQKAYGLQQALSTEYHIREKGTIRGLRRIVVKRKGRAPADVFELRINVPWEDEIKRTTISIAVHGEEQAFRLSVEKICEWYGLKPRSEAAKAMQECLPAYQVSAEEESKHQETAAISELVVKKAKDEFSNITDGLMKGLKRFTA
ncbi:hypothetical protein A3752_07980 [Oleiphilus sp. HI0081]|nr:MULTISPECIES: hypothetical protein [unclassified Oleiphilus]KZY84786.1 hypothetical protein A3743_03845 [Oleiphilus sp. HI0072]KZZ11133.1 hypothetical protein A3749_09700 [Oleiphilus sp. HI0078]KZZ21838.1 hypothetical protein A3752_07980 [Oleiphilus sp. HI0081]KZY28731.1 hypothetical protein A3729_13175 [Oleiphilus sp. HI0043]KZZ65904.1 hypothetical protein A3763_03650 [Oleiphilus sp. HI0128]